MDLLDLHSDLQYDLQNHLLDLQNYLHLWNGLLIQIRQYQEIRANSQPLSIDGTFEDQGFFCQANAISGKGISFMDVFKITLCRLDGAQIYWLTVIDSGST